MKAEKLKENQQEQQGKKGMGALEAAIIYLRNSSLGNSVITGPNQYHKAENRLRGLAQEGDRTVYEVIARLIQRAVEREKRLEKTLRSMVDERNQAKAEPEPEMDPLEALLFFMENEDPESTTKARAILDNNRRNEQFWHHGARIIRERIEELEEELKNKKVSYDAMKLEVDRLTKENDRLKNAISNAAHVVQDQDECPAKNHANKKEEG